MPKDLQARPGWRGQWYVYNHVKKEFLRSRGGVNGAEWTPGIKHAKRYKNPALAQKSAACLNALLHHPGSACWPCQPVSVVSGEAARCLDAINRRDIERPENSPVDCFQRDGAGRPKGSEIAGGRTP